jgi:hypothetical protein
MIPLLTKRRRLSRDIVRAMTLLLLLLQSCKKETATIPETNQQPLADCESNRTGTLIFRNTSSRATYSVYVDGTQFATLEPDQESRKEVSAGVSHSLSLTFRNSSQQPCAPTTFNVSQCATQSFACSFDRYITVRHAASFLNGGVSVSLYGRQYEIDRNGSVNLPIGENTTMAVWECVGATCRWDGGYNVTPYGRYKVIHGSGPQWDLTVVPE